MTVVLISRREETQKHKRTPGGEVQVTTEAEIGAMQLQGKALQILLAPTESRTRQERDLESQAALILLTPGSRTSSLQNWKRICFCGLESPSL